MNSSEENITPTRFTLRKPEKLRHKNLVDPLFREGKSSYCYPLRMVWRQLSDDELTAAFRNGLPREIGPVQMMITIPKKKRRRAVDRVLMRRRIREAYRLSRLPMVETAKASPSGGTVSVSFIYMATENIPYAKIDRSMKILLSRLSSEISPKDNDSILPSSESGE